MKRDVETRQLASPDLGTLDPLEWAKKPRSQWALDFLRRGSEYDHRLLDILTNHMESGVCDDTGQNLLKRWDGQRWVAA